MCFSKSISNYDFPFQIVSHTTQNRVKTMNIHDLVGFGYEMSMGFGWKLKNKIIKIKISGKPFFYIGLTLCWHGVKRVSRQTHSARISRAKKYFAKSSLVQSHYLWWTLSDSSVIEIWSEDPPDFRIFRKFIYLSWARSPSTRGVRSSDYVRCKGLNVIVKKNQK